MIAKHIKIINLRYLRYRHPLDMYPASFDRHKCIFFHIPKAAGTSVSLSLFGYQVGHLSFDQMYYSNPKKASEYFKFTFVRNPWSRLVSAYQFLSAGGMNPTDKIWAENNLIKNEGFNEFVLRWVNDENINSYIHFIPQYKFITDRNGVIRADFVGKTENFQKDFEIISSEIGMKSTLLHSNKSNNSLNNKSYTAFYDNVSKEIVASVYQRDIELFGYKFDE